MKLRNKKTGEIGHLRSINWNETALIIMDKDGVQLAKYSSLAELNADWEDMSEEPKDYYFIRSESLTLGYSPISNTCSCRNRKAIGNYFETKEEAEKAVEKLKAWKRLEDNGFRVIDYGDEDIRYEIRDRYDRCLSDLETALFGGEE